MTDHIHGEDSYVECDWYTVVSEHSLADIYANCGGWNGETSCYCGADSEYIARVGFHTDTSDPDDIWPSLFSRNVKVHRCEKHRFNSDDTQ